MRRDLLIGIVLAALTLGVYSPVRTHNFIFYDDPEFITENPQIQSGLSWQTVRYAFSRPVVGNWHPVTTLSHALDCELFGINPGAHHLVNALIHSLNAALLFLLMQQLLRMHRLSPGVAGDQRVSKGSSKPIAVAPGIRLSAFVALVFALHPLRVESVAWLAERKDVLSGCFFLLSLWLYVQYAERSGNRRIRIADTDGKQIGTREIAKGEAGRARKNGEKQGGGAAESPQREMGFYAGALLSFALGLMSKPMVVTLPFVLMLLDYWPLRRFEISNLRSQISTLRCLLLEKLPFLLLSALDCGITIAVQKGAGATQVIADVTWAERLANAATSYVKYLGKLFWPTDLAILYPHPAKHYFLTERWPGWEIVLAVLLLVLFTGFCILQARGRPYFLFGWFWFLGTLVPVIGLIQVGEQAMADRYTYIPLIGPVFSLAWWMREIGARRERSFKWIQIERIAGFLLITVLAFLTGHQLGYWQDTVELFDHAIAVTADNPSAQFALGVGLERQGEVGKAMVRYRVATAIDPHYGKAYYNLGQLLRKAGYWQQAAQAYLAAAKLNPSDLATQLNLASALPHVGRTQEAIAHFDRALELDPNSIEALNNLAWLLSTSPDPQTRNGPRAVQLAEQGCALTDSKAPFLLGTLAAAYAQAGRFGDAVLAGEQACARATEMGDLASAARNRELVEVYRASKPYREEWK